MISIYSRAPDLATPTNQTSGSEKPSGTGNGRLNGGHNIAVRRAGNSKAVKQALAPEASAQLRDRLLAELNNLGSADDAAMWAHRSLGEKQQTDAAGRSACGGGLPEAVRAGT